MSIGGGYFGSEYPAGDSSTTGGSVAGVMALTFGALTVTVTGKRTAASTVSFTFGGLTLTASGAVTHPSDTGMVALPFGALDVEVGGGSVAGLRFGGLTLAIDTTPKTVQATAGFAFGLDFDPADNPTDTGPGLVITITVGIGVALFDADNQWITNLPLAAGIKYQCTVTDPGMVSLRLPLNDAATALATPGRFLKVYRNGRCRQAAQITDSGVDIAKDGTLWRSFDNLPGVLNLLAQGCVWPEYGLDRTYSTSRTFGPQSATGAWFANGNWTHPEIVRYQEDTGFRQLKPAGLAYPNPWWISKYGPYVDRPAGTVEWHRHHFTTYGDDEINVQILATADDLVSVWLDGEQIVTPDAPAAQRWLSLFQVVTKIQPGLHVVAMKVRNSVKKASPLASILALQQLQENGDVVLGGTIARTSDVWNTADTNLGFRKADVIRRCVFENRDNHSIDVFDLIRLAFDENVDTTGQAWTDDPDEHTRDVGENLLTTVQALCEKGMDADMDPARLKLRLWRRKGSDKRSTVILRRGAGVSIGSILDGSVARQAPRFTVVLVQLADTTWVEFADADLVAGYGRIVTAVSAGDTRTEERAQRIADGMFNDQALAATQIAATITGLDGPQYERDFVDGDTISVEDENLDLVPVRVMSGLVDGDRDGEPTVELELMLDLT